jgi:3-ketosteroid 9alpha-monooxygenase subunit B
MSDELIKGKKIRSISGLIVKATRETPDTWTLDIEVADQDKNYLAGQFISINPHQFPELRDFIKYFEYQKGKKEPIRAYSLTSAPHEKYVSITIKPESYFPEPDAFPPLLSPFLASDFLVGRQIEFTGYAGGYVMPENLRAGTDHVIHLVAGSGVVPSFSIIKDELLARQSCIRHSLVTVNKRIEDIIFHEELKELCERFPEHLKVYYYLTQEKTLPGSNYFAGRPDNSHIEKLVTDKERTIVFACGPAITKWQKKAVQNPEELKPRFMEWVQEVVDKLDLDKHRFKREIYG